MTAVSSVPGRQACLLPSVRASEIVAKALKEVEIKPYNRIVAGFGQPLKYESVPKTTRLALSVSEVLGCFGSTVRAPAPALILPRLQRYDTPNIRRERGAAKCRQEPTAETEASEVHACWSVTNECSSREWKF
jgi:hypothetical protein